MAIAWQAQFQREVGGEPPGPPLEDGPFARVSAAIMRYDVFPVWLIRGVLRQAPVLPGDTVGIQMRLLPSQGSASASRFKTPIRIRS